MSLSFFRTGILWFGNNFSRLFLSLYHYFILKFAKITKRKKKKKAIIKITCLEYPAEEISPVMYKNNLMLTFTIQIRLSFSDIVIIIIIIIIIFFYTELLHKKKKKKKKNDFNSIQFTTCYISLVFPFTKY